MQIELSEEHFKNVSDSIRFTAQVASNVTVWREVQNVKQREAIISTEDGMEIDLSDVQFMNALASIS
jgi:hypothetical protein